MTSRLIAPDALDAKKAKLKLEAVEVVQELGKGLTQEERDLLVVSIYQPENLTVYEYLCAAAEKKSLDWNIALTLAKNAIRQRTNRAPVGKNSAGSSGYVVTESFSSAPSRENSRPVSPDMQEALLKKAREAGKDGNPPTPAEMAVAVQKGSPKWTGRKGATNDDFDDIFKRNRAWAAQKVVEDPNFFKALGAGQQPKFLWVGCSDARVPANEITGLPPGEVFVHRNVANLVVNTDTNILAVLQFAIEYLKVPDIIVCGHYGCGGVKASLKEHDHGLIEHWISNIRDVQRLYQDELNSFEDENERSDRLVELNVIEQCVNLLKNPIVQRSQIKYGYPRVHAFVYSVHDGLLRELDADLMGYVDRHKEIYSLFDFSKKRQKSLEKSMKNASV